MRSELVFSAAVNTPNRFMLCRMISMSARTALKRPGSFAEGINSCLVLAGKEEETPAPVPGEVSNDRA
jgi:hypothetical protein